ncbi:RNA polymerase, alpha subunit, C-terminal [uncultured Caudovirales phage]|uniref:RNA polymerase, alpha subunit, C-terminal n=1 Tax=uncultured Caudovirales phage TaxID=2100421 RepID=A0A6J5SA90_9CAUD|nr:RNA polymerase, alpha subunit, C-terminal [uncultured Caudovirales phage]CAB4176048.1 RNA polymerase, alpha subunit, C-terminal [uncultured Caudovirales phage]CAB4181013.1 RNA polymerase, alpha subunit, C-terminal [uncultured Caudovirales phage]CAB4198215.1 RNA polymerase, alpha subunit, C-terminal [uncultured Caudovirales phage]CAB4210535.1 RNA polymerase, alpha subunit, C-terminal [uncultured Caudovirales phage]
MTNKSKLKLEGNIIGYMCESSLDGWNYCIYNKNINTIFIDTYETPGDFVLKLNSDDSMTYAALTYDTKEECLADRDKLLDWLRGDNNETNNLNKPVLEEDKELRKLLEQPLSEQALDNLANYLIGWEKNCGLSVRILNCFLNKDPGYPNNLRELLMMTDSQLLEWPNFWRKSLNDFKEWLNDMNLKTGMTQKEIEKFLIFFKKN